MPTTINIKNGKLISYPDFCPVCEKKGKLKRLLVGSCEKERDKKLKDLKNRELHVPIHSACRSLRELKAGLSTVIVLVLTITIFNYFIGAVEEYEYTDDIFFYIIGIPIYLIMSKIIPLPIDVNFYDSYISFDFKSEKYALEFEKINEKSIHEV